MEPIQHIYTFQAINKPIARRLCNLIDRISGKLSSDEKEKLVSIASDLLLKELYTTN